MLAVLIIIGSHIWGVLDNLLATGRAFLTKWFTILLKSISINRSADHI